jgi:hypothetical protein
MQDSKISNKETRQRSSIIGIFCFALGGFVFSAWTTFAVWEILKAPIIVELLASTSGLIGFAAFALMAIGIKLIHQ